MNREVCEVSEIYHEHDTWYENCGEKLFLEYFFYRALSKFILDWETLFNIFFEIICQNWFYFNILTR